MGAQVRDGRVTTNLGFPQARCPSTPGSERTPVAARSLGEPWLRWIQGPCGEYQISRLIKHRTYKPLETVTPTSAPVVLVKFCKIGQAYFRAPSAALGRGRAYPSCIARPLAAPGC